ncbi:PIG-L deacetylase family protein [Luedemannella flava]
MFAHPDDVDFGAAGTIAGWVDAGIDVTYVIVTRGDAGGFDDTPREHIPAIREAEQRAAASVVGVKTVEFLDGYADGTVTASLGLRRDIIAAIRRHRPDRVITNSRCAGGTASRVPATRTTWPSARRRRARSTPTRATRSPIRSC